MSKSLSGFPEWLPAQRQLELLVLDTCRVVFELNGFASFESRAVESVATLARKGDITKEVYAIARLAQEKPFSEVAPEDQLALHFDLTVPFARFVVENAGKLDFPFRRYQIQKAWRGERPQEGRYREFTQADIDIVGVDELPAHHDVEVLLVMSEVFNRLAQHGLPQIDLRLNNRKLSEGFYRGIGVEDPDTVLQLVDKLDKAGPEKVVTWLEEKAGLSKEQAQQCLALANIRGSAQDVAQHVADLGVSHEMLDEGCAELVAVLTELEAHGAAASADLSVARGLDYYTGTVYESTMQGFESLGSVCSGGRYASLAKGQKNTYPGVGISLGVSRIVGPLLSAGYSMSRSVPSCVLVSVATEEHRGQARRVARTLQARGISALVAPTAAKFGKQIKYADRLGVPFVWFPSSEGHEVKDIRTGEQVAAEPDQWRPPLADVVPSVVVPQSAKDLDTESE